MNQLRELERAATPGPWRWAGHVNRPMITTVNRGMVYVMGFTRSGMQDAQPTFQVHETIGNWGGGRMVPASALAVREVPYRDDIVDIDHPDARLLIALRNLAPGLLDVVDAAQAFLGATGNINREHTEERLAKALASLDAKQADS